MKELEETPTLLVILVRLLHYTGSNLSPQISSYEIKKIMEVKRDALSNKKQERSSHNEYC